MTWLDPQCLQIHRDAQECVWWKSGAARSPPQWPAIAAGAQGDAGARTLTGELYLDSGEFLGRVHGVVHDETRRIGVTISN